MSILHRLIKRKKQDKQIIWGIRVPEKVKIGWLILAAIMRVPCNRLVLFILQDWLRQNADMLLDDQVRNRLADRITESYLNKSFDK